jgi:hypothetical protein
MKTKKRITTTPPDTKSYKANLAGKRQNKNSTSLAARPEVDEKRPARRVHSRTDRKEHRNVTAYRKPVPIAAMA